MFSYVKTGSNEGRAPLSSDNSCSKRQCQKLSIPVMVIVSICVFFVLFCFFNKALAGFPVLISSVKKILFWKFNYN